MSEHEVSNPKEAAEELQKVIGEKVSEYLDLIRHHSHNGELVAVADLELPEGFSDEDREELYSRLLENDEVKKLETSDGRAFLYSSALMVERYAKVVLQREENDPKRLIAETIREESQLYPRPTAVEIFTLPPYKIPVQILETIVTELVEDTGEYADIKESMASTGARYLYSDRHLEKQHADYLVEWREVGQYENQ